MFWVALVGTVLASELVVTPPRVPPYVPRYAAAGIFVTQDAVAPLIKVGWQLSLLNGERYTDLDLFFEAGTARAISGPDITVFREHMFTAGLALCSVRGRKLYWKLQGGAGPVWYGGKVHGLDELNVATFTDLRFELGGDLGAVSLAAFVGYGGPIYFDPRVASAIYVGGPHFGVAVSWR